MKSGNLNCHCNVLIPFNYVFPYIPHVNSRRAYVSIKHWIGILHIPNMLFAILCTSLALLFVYFKYKSIVGKLTIEITLHRIRNYFFLYPRGKSRNSMKLFTHLHLMLRLRNCEGLPSLPLYTFMAWFLGTGMTSHVLPLFVMKCCNSMVYSSL
jgi:hypothetical protein